MKARHLSSWILAADLIWIVLALFGAYLLRYGASWSLLESVSGYSLLAFLVLTWAVWAGLSFSTSLDGFYGGWRASAMVAHVSLAVGCTMGTLLALAYLWRHYVSRLALVYFGVLLLAGFVAIRCVAWLVLRARHRAGEVWRVVILGSGRVARELSVKLSRHPEMLCKVVGLIFPEESSAEDLDFVRANKGSSHEVSTFGITSLLCEQQVDEVIVALAQPAVPEIRSLVARCRECGIRVSMVPQPYELYLARPNLIDVDGLPILQFREAGASTLFLKGKRVVDLALGALLALPAMLVVLPAACVLLATKRKAFRWETRCGQFGIPFSMLRLNVDRHVAQSSRFEELLESLSVTELPQLWNVLRGQMSLVGPRPESQLRVRGYSDWHQQRLTAKPGMTGLAQVHGLREQNSSEEKARFDLQYLMNRSLLSDLSLLLQTAWILILRFIRFFRPGKPGTPASGASPSQPPRMKEIFHRAHSTQPSAD